MRHDVWLGALLALGMAGEAAAREPVPPLRVRDGAEPWTVTVRIDTRQFGAVRVVRELFMPHPNTGTTEELYSAVVGQESPFLLRTVSLQPQDLAGLADGAYYLAVVAEGQPRDPEAPRFRNKHLVHLKVEDGLPKRLTQAEYSALADPAQVVEGPDGVRVTVHRGAVVPGPRPLPGPSSADPVESINTSGEAGSTSEKRER